MARLAGLLSERFGGARAFFCNSGHRGGRGGAEVGAQGDGAAGRRRARQLVPRPHARLARRHRPAREARRVGAARARRAVREAERRRRRSPPRSGPTPAAILLEPVQGEGGIHAATPGVPRRRAARSPTSTARCSCFDEVQTGVGRTGSFFAWEQLGVAPGRGHARQGPRQRAADRRVPRRRRGACGPRAGRPRAAPSAATRSPARRRAPSSRRVDADLLASVRAKGERLAAGLAALPGVVEVRGRGLLLGAELDRPAGAGRRGLSRPRGSSSAPPASACSG